MQNPLTYLDGDTLIGALVIALCFTPLAFVLIAISLQVSARRLARLAAPIERALSGRPVMTSDLACAAENLERASALLRGAGPAPASASTPVITPELVGRMTLPPAPPATASRPGRKAREAAHEAVERILSDVYAAGDESELRADVLMIADRLESELRQGKLDLRAPAPDGASRKEMADRIAAAISAQPKGKGQAA